MLERFCSLNKIMLSSRFLKELFKALQILFLKIDLSSQHFVLKDRPSRKLLTETPLISYRRIL